MNMTRPSPLGAAAEVPVAQIAKAALRRLAAERLEPTPENYERAYRHESGGGETNAESLATLIERIVRGLERGGRNWTPARRKEGIHRVFVGSRADPGKMQQRLTQLVNRWESDSPPTQLGLLDDAASTTLPPATLESVPALGPTEGEPSWQRLVKSLGEAFQQSLPKQDVASQELDADLSTLLGRVAVEGATTAVADDMAAIAQRADRLLQHRHHLFEQLGKLCGELTASLADFAEDGSWVKGQCEAMRRKIDEGLTARGVRAVSDMLHHARKQHGEVRGEREKARDTLKSVIAQMLAELDELGSTTGNFHESVGRYAAVIEESDSIESLTGVVREMVAESRAVQTLVQQTQERLKEEHSKATGLTERVTQLEDEMKRLSDEVSTDQLTQIANRRGLLQAFELERARLEKNGGELSIGLLDIDNFKRLNDELGHSAGDEALKSLAAIVSKALRPTDHVARYGGEEFVVLLPQTPASEGEQVLTRLQRSLTGGLFMHKDKQIFVTFSAGVTRYRGDERIEQTLERADQALYEAKRTGKNRTCIG